MNLLSKLFGSRPPATKASTYTLDNVYRPARVAPEVWVNFGVEVEEVDFAEFEASQSSASQPTSSFQFQ